MNSLFQFSAIRSPTSRRIFLGQLISQVCDKVMSVGMIWVISTRFSLQWVPWFIALGALPHLVMASYSPKWVSKFGALRVVIGTDLFRGTLFLSAAWIVHATSSLTLAILMITAVVSSFAGSLFNPAILTLPVQLAPVEHRQQLTAMLDSCFSFANVLGPFLSVVIYPVLGLSGLLAVNGLSYLFSGFLALRIRVEPSRRAGGQSLESNAAAAPIFELLKKEPVISLMLLNFLLMNLFLAPVMMFLPWYANNIYHEGISGLAWLEGSMGAGTVVGSVLLSFVQIPGAVWKRIALSLLLVAVAYLLFTLSRSLWVGCVTVAVLGLFLALANIVILGLFQAHPREKDVPAVMGLVNLISVASLPVSMGVLGYLGSRIGSLDVARLALSCAVVLLLLSSMVGWIPGIRRI